MPSPLTLRATASDLDRHAGELRVALEAVRVGVGPHVWVGPAADHFGSDLALLRRQLEEVAGELRGTAGRLRAEAETRERALTLAPAPDEPAVAAGGQPWERARTGWPR